MATGEAALGGRAEPPDADRVLVHDFRNLLAVIVNYCELIAAETTDPEAIKADIAEVRAAAERALVLCDRLRLRNAQASGSEPAAGAT